MKEITFSAKSIAPKSIQKIHIQPSIRVVVRQLVIAAPPDDVFLIAFHAGGNEWLDGHALPLYLFSRFAVPIDMEHKIDPDGRVSMHFYNKRDTPIDLDGALLVEAAL